MYVKEHRTVGFDSFKYTEGVDPLLLSHFFVYHHSDVQKDHTLGVTSKVMSQQMEQSQSPKTDDLSKKRQKNFSSENGSIGEVTIQSKKNLVCIPGNSVITVLGHTSKIPSKTTCLVE